MNFFEWFRLVNGKFVTSPNAPSGNKYQCMQLMHDYCMKVLGLTATDLAAPSAKQLFYSFPNVKGSKYFTKIINRPWNTPKQGDIVFFGSGQFGHVCIFNEGNVFRFTSIDQNLPLNSPVHLQTHSYLGCLGWLRKR